MNSLRIAVPSIRSAAFTTSLCRRFSVKEEIGKRDIIDFLNSADLSIKDISAVDEDFRTKKAMDDLPKIFRDEFPKELKGRKLPSLDSQLKPIA